MKYSLRVGVGVPAHVVGAEFERILGEHGAVTAKLLLEEAKPARAPLHKAFVWNDAQAGLLYRMDQARHLIRAVHIVEEDGTDGGCAFVRVSAFDPETEEGGESKYLPVAQVVHNPDLFGFAVRALTANVQSAQGALKDLHAQALKLGNNKHSMLAKAGRGLDIASKNLQQAARK